jgi:predicted dehydrogenase
MRINFHGRLVDDGEIRAGTIGCGSHSFRNIYPTFQYAPVNLVATCDLSIEKAEAFAAKFGAASAYSDYHRMLEKEELDAVFIVVGYDERGRPLYPDITVDCLNAGVHVWMEKPPAALCSDVERMQAAAEANGKNVVVGMKKMFMPASTKAKALMDSEDFGQTSLALLQYPQHIPTVEELRRYIEDEEKLGSVVGFVDHLVHPMSLMVFLLGMPKTLCYQRSASGGGVANFTFDSGAVGSLAMTRGASNNCGMERTTIVSDRGRHIVVENNIRLAYHRSPSPEPGTGYGNSPNYFTGTPGEASTVWEPEFSLGQLYNKGLFLVGYYDEVNEFARSILEDRPPAKGTLDQAWQITQVFEAFLEGPGKTIPLIPSPPGRGPG